MEFINRYSATETLCLYLDNEVLDGSTPQGLARKLYPQGPPLRLSWKRTDYPDPDLPPSKVFLRLCPQIRNLPAQMEGVFYIAKPDVALIAALYFKRPDILAPIWPEGVEQRNSRGDLVVFQLDSCFDPGWVVEIEEISDLLLESRR